MADLALTSANVLPSAAAVKVRVTLAVACLAGQPIYLDPATLDAAGNPEARLCLATGAPPIGQCAGLLANGGSAGQKVDLILDDPLYTHGLTGAVAGNIVVVSDVNAGGLTLSANTVTAGDYVNVVGVCINATQMVLRRVVGTAAHA